MTPDRIEAAQAWEERYVTAISPTIGSINGYLIDMLGGRSPGTALELGCSQGADVIWLASHGWTVTGVDIAPTAIARARSFAVEHGVADRTTFEVRDLAVDFPEGTFDVVYAHFFHTWEEFPRAEVLSRAAQAVGPGGMLLLIDHGSSPHASAHGHEFLTPRETIDSMQLAGAEWSDVRVDTVDREVTSPEGELMIIVDNIIAIERLGS